MTDPRISRSPARPRRLVTNSTLALALVASRLGTAHAASTGTLPYRGEVAEGGQKLSGKRALRLTVKTHPTTGQVLFQQTFENVEFSVGRFAVELGACAVTGTTCTDGSGVATSLAAVLATRPAALYVNVAVADQGLIAGATFSPMGAWQRITSAPFALEAPRAILGRWRTQLSQCGDVSSDSSSALGVSVPLTRPAVLSVRYRARHDVGALAVASVSTSEPTGTVVRERRAFVRQNGDESSIYWVVDGSASFDVPQATTMTVRVSIQNANGNATVQSCPTSATDPSSFLEVTAYAK